MSLSSQIEARLKEMLDIDDLEEISSTGGGEAYNTPHAFIDDEDDNESEVAGYKKVKESLFSKVAKESFITEATYRDYKKDDQMSNKKKVNKAIKEINGKLFRIERIIDQNIKLKKEEGIDQNKYWKATRGNLYKISEKMVRISEKLRKF